MTRIWLLSDLHVDASPWVPSRIPPHEICVIAGDVRDGLVRSLYWLAEYVLPWSPAVVHVPGNHDFWGSRWQSELARGRALAISLGIALLAEGEAVELAGVRLVGGTLWTDYEVGPIPRAAAMAACGDRMGGMRDHRKIKERLPDGGRTPSGRLRRCASMSYSAAGSSGSSRRRSPARLSLSRITPRTRRRCGMVSGGRRRTRPTAATCRRS